MACFDGVSGIFGRILSLALKYVGCSLMVGCSIAVLFVLLFKILYLFDSFDFINVKPLLVKNVPRVLYHKLVLLSLNGLEFFFP